MTIDKLSIQPPSGGFFVLIIKEYTREHHMTVWFYEHLLNHVHWIWIRLLEDAPKDAIHRRLTWVFDNGVRDAMICHLKAQNAQNGDEIDFSACPGD